jgi:hypothetical protein
MNAKMNLLALALLGLAGYAGSAVAGCPASPVPPWTAAPALGGTVAIVTGGLDGSACRMESGLTGDSSSFATVEDDTPTAEPRYRASFMINTDAVNSMSVITAVFVFTATSAAGGNPPVSLSIVGDGAGNALLSYNVVNGTGALVGSAPLAAGANHVEFDYDNGSAAGSPGPHFSLWINSNVEANTTFNATISSTAVVDTAFLGLAGSTSDWSGSFNGTAVQFDAFDSRRSSFIGY